MTTHHFSYPAGENDTLRSGGHGHLIRRDLFEGTIRSLKREHGPVLSAVEAHSLRSRSLADREYPVPRAVADGDDESRRRDDLPADFNATVIKRGFPARNDPGAQSYARPRRFIMQDIHQLRVTIKQMLDSQRLAVLATQGEGRPYGSLVAFAATEDMRNLLFATTRATRKYANLLKKRGVTLVIDTRTNQTADFADAAAVTVLGDVEEIADHERQGLARIYLDKHPYLREFVESPTTALIRVDVKTYIMVNRFQNVQELHIIP